MNKKDLADIVAGKTTLTKAQIRQVVDETFESIIELLAKGEKLQVAGFGSFSVKKRSERTGTNPQTGEKIRIEAKTVPVFSPGKKLLQAVNQEQNQ